MISQFHLLRPEWLLAFIPLLILSGLLLRKKLFSHSWHNVVDPRLLPHLLMGKTGKKNHSLIILFIFAGSLAIIALAGPAWNKLPQPVYQDQSALIIALDLSRSMDAIDIKPSRIVRARHKITDILKLRQEGQTALIAYAADAFTVSPLTDDTETINALVPSLSSEIMPSQGSRADRVILKAKDLFKNAGVTHGDILFITDGIDPTFKNTFINTYKQGHRISILALGTQDGAPIALSDGGFLKDNRGSIVIPKLNATQLESLALSAGGRFSLLTADDRDIKNIITLFEVNRMQADASKTTLKTDVWQEEGPWLLLFLIPLTLIGFRRGILVSLIVVLFPLPQQAQAISWDELWQNDNQRAAQQLQQGKTKEAAELFKQPEWKAAAHYKAGQYEKAIQQLQGIDRANAHYNRGNALAKLGKIEEAILAYNQSLKLNPDHKDAKYNKSLLEQQQAKKNRGKGKNTQSSNKKQASSKDQQKNTNTGKGNNSQNKGDKQEKNTASNRQQPAKDTPKQDKQEQNQQQEAQPKEKISDAQHAEKQTDNSDITQAQRLSKQAIEQWLRRIPDDPGGLLKRKFKYQYQQQRQHNEKKPW